MFKLSTKARLVLGIFKCIRKTSRSESVRGGELTPNVELFRNTVCGLEERISYLLR